MSPPSTERAETRHLDREEARRLLEVAQGHRLDAAVILGLAGGMRLADVFALEWADVHFATGKVGVTKSAWGPTRNGKARAFTLPEPQLARLRRIKVEPAERLLLFGIRQNEKTTVVEKREGTPMTHQTLAGAFARFAAEHGFPISFHGLRHSNAIALLTSGVDVKTAAARLGHNPALLLNT